MKKEKAPAASAVRGLRRDFRGVLRNAVVLEFLDQISILYLQLFDESLLFFFLHGFPPRYGYLIFKQLAPPAGAGRPYSPPLLPAIS